MVEVWLVLAKDLASILISKTFRSNEFYRRIYKLSNIILYIFKIKTLIAHHLSSYPKLPFPVKLKHFVFSYTAKYCLLHKLFTARRAAIFDFLEGNNIGISFRIYRLGWLSKQMGSEMDRWLS